MFSNWFTKPSHAKQSMDEAKAKEIIDTFLNYRRNEVVMSFVALWFVILFMVFSFLVILKLPSFVLYGCWN